MNFFDYRYRRRFAEDSDFDESNVRRAPKGKGGGQFAKKPETFAREDARDVLNKGELDPPDSSAALDAEYMEAVEKGDMRKCKRMLFDLFKKRFPDNKAVYDNGEPGVFYHGTGEEFNKFDTEVTGETSGEGSGGAYFTTSEDIAQAYADMYEDGCGKVKECLMYLKDPFIVPCDGLNFDEVSIPEEGTGKEIIGTDAISFYLRNKGENDGVAFTNIIDVPTSYSEDIDDLIYEESQTNPYVDEFYERQKYLVATEVVAFNSNHIFSADPVTYDDDGNVIPLSKRFDTTNPDIRY